jgi:hypothetical protein
MIPHPSSYRRLQPAEIATLEAQGCAAADWTQVWVHPNFSPLYVHDTLMEGTNVLGDFGAPAEAVWRRAGLYRVRLREVTVGHRCLLQDVDEVANYTLGDEVQVLHVGRLCATGDSCFGNATAVAVLNESGGREVLMHDALTAQEAYLMALHSYQPELLAPLRARIHAHADSLRGERGQLGDGVTVAHVRSVRNVRVGAAARIMGACCLENGSIVSTPEAPVEVGDGVMATDFIIRGGSHVLSGASLVRSFVGESCHIGHGFSATDSLFFANCQMEHGEACALWAGPFSVSHHRATLLIACMTSFFNAGSGSNQSNHSYKLGPNKYGILERGAKLASSSYLYWPARIGAFSTVLGHHSGHVDLSDFPFSLLMEQKGRSLLLPAVNLRSIGLVRDVQKWPTRDARPQLSADSDRLTFALLNPYTAARIERAMSVLRGWLAVRPADDVADGQPAAGPQKADYFEYRGVYIPHSVVRRAYATYSAALDEYLCRCILLRLEHVAETAATAPYLQADDRGCGAWCDYGGMIAPQAEVEGAHLLTPSDEDLAAWEWNWVAAAAGRIYGHRPADMTEDDLCKIAVLYELTSEWLQSERLADSTKEYNATARLLYGADGTEADREADFTALFGAQSMDDAFVHRFHQAWKEQRAAIVQIGRRFRSDVMENPSASTPIDY